MEMSKKHMEMIQLALSKHIEDLELDVDQLTSEDLRVELQEFRNLRSQIEDLILRQ